MTGDVSGMTWLACTCELILSEGITSLLTRMFADGIWGVGDAVAVTVRGISVGVGDGDGVTLRLLLEAQATVNTINSTHER